MFEGFLEKFLLKYFGEYLCGIDKTNLSIAVWKGEINVRTVDINPDILKKLSLPLRLVFGRIDSLVLKVPWKNLSSSPVEVSIESISVVLALEDLATWFQSRSYLDLCNTLLDAIQDEMTRKIEEESEKKDDKATFFETIFDNLMVSVRNIHIRVECPFNPHTYVFGAVLEDFSLRSVDPEGKPIFVKRASKTEKVTKLVRFNNLQLYHDAKIQTGRNINLIEYFFKSTKADGHQILQLSLDVIFSVEPYSPGATRPVYQIATDIASISTAFEPGTIRDFAHFVEYLGAFKQCRLDFLEKQKYNHLKPRRRLAEFDKKTQKTERKTAVREWFRFGVNCVATEIRSKKKGKYLFGIPQSKKNFLKAELLMLLEKRFSTKLAKEEPERLAWLVQLFSLKELPELAKSASFEAYKKNTKTKKKDVSFDQVNFFSVQELPEAFNYMEAKATLRHCQAKVRSDGLNLEMVSNSVVVEYKARTRGQDLLLSVFSIAANIQKGDDSEKETIALGEPGPNGEGLLSLVLRQEKTQSLIFGRVRRALFFYRSEISSLLHRFVSVLEESLASVGADTQEILGAGSTSGATSQIINVHVEAPILFFPENDKLWVADLGTFDVKQDSPDVNPNGLISLEGRQTQLYFQPANRVMNSLNSLEKDPNYLPSLLKSMSLAVEDLGFRIEVGIARSAKTDTTAARSIPSYQVDCRPFKISLTQHSLTSLYTLQAKLTSDLSRHQEWLERTRSRADWTHKGLDFDTGYEQWARTQLLLVGRVLHVVDRRTGRFLGTLDLGAVLETKLDETKLRLVLLLKARRVQFRAERLQDLQDVRFKIDSIVKLVAEESKKPREEQSAPTATSPDDGITVQGEDFVMGLRMTSVELNIAEYSEGTVPFGVVLGGVSYKSEWVNQIEQGELRLQSAAVRSLQEQEMVIKVKEQNPALLYSFVYRSGLLKQKMVLGQLDSVYKPKYIQSALKLIETLASIFLTNEEDIQQVESTEEAPILSTIRKETSVMIQTVKTSIHYKGDMKNLEFITTGLETDIVSQGDDLGIDVRIAGVGLYDLHKYPFREDQNSVVRVPLLQMKRSGSVEVKILMNSVDISVETKVKHLVIDWVQQRFMRFIDFLMYQVLEVLYPSLFSLAQFYSRDKIVKMSLGLLNDPSFVKQKIVLECTEFNLVSTTNTDHKIGLMVQTTEVTNSRILLPKIVNQPKYFPLQQLESDRWDVRLLGVQLNIIDETLLDEMAVSKHKAVEPASEKFDLFVSVDFLAKLFELSFLYEIVDDLQNFTAEELEVVRSRESAFLSGTEASQLKQKPSNQEIDAQVQEYLTQSEKERLAVDGRYRIRVTSSRIGLLLTNRFINKMYNISSNNISFDDGKDELLRQVYVSSTQGLQVFVGMKVDVFEAVVPEYKNPEQILFRLTFEDFNMLVDKQSTYTNYIDLDAASLGLKFDESMEIPAQYQNFMQSHVSDDHTRGFVCKMQLYPDYKKDIQVDCYGVRLIVFQFLLRLLPELTTLEPYIEHPGYEDPNYSLINIQVQMHDTELCLVSQKEGCVVMAGKLDYQIDMDAVASNHTISLKDMECLDCPEQAYFASSLDKIAKRAISRKFDLVFTMRSDIHLNTDYGLEIDKILLKLTAFNLRTFSEVGAYQGELVASTMKYSLIDPSTVPVLLWKTNATLNIGGLSLMYVDNYRDIFIPALRLDLDVQNFVYRYDEQLTKLESSLSMKASFNNSRTAKWEPFLESFPLDIEMVTADNKTMVYMLGGEPQTDEGLYLNFGEELLEVLLHCTRNASNVFLERSLVATEEGIIYDSQFLVRNKTGYDIVVQTIGDKESHQTKVKNVGEKFVNFIIEDEFSNNQQSRRLLRVNLDPSTGYTETLEFSVDKVGQQQKTIGNSIIIITVKKEQLKRVAVISSRVIIQNITKLPLELMLFDSGGVHDKKIISDDKERFPVKFDKLDSILTIALESAVAPQVKLADILANKARRTIKIPLVCASEDYNSLALEVYTKGLVTFFEIKPALRIQNLSPLDLRCIIFKQTKPIESLLITKMELAEVFRYDPYKEESLIQFEAGEFYASDAVDLKKLLLKPNMESMKIQLLNKRAVFVKGAAIQDPPQFSLEVVTNRKDNTLIVFAKMVVLNETGIPNMQLGTSDSKSAKVCTVLACPDGKMMFPADDKHKYVVVGSTDPTLQSKKTTVSREEAVETPVCFAAEGYEWDLTLQPRVIRLNDTFPMKVLTFLPKYVVVNDSNSLIGFVQENGYETILNPGCRTPVIWKHKTRTLAIKPRTDEGSETSEKFDLGQPGHYELRLSGEFYKLKVSSQSGTTYCHVSQLQDTDVTKKIDNRTPYTIRVRSKGHAAEPPQEIASGECKPFAQKYPIQAGAVLKLDLLVPNEDKTDVLTCEANCLILTTTPRLIELGMPEYLLRVSVAFQGAHTVVSVDLVGRGIPPQDQKEGTTELRLRINLIDISVLHAPHKQRRREVLNVLLSGLLVKLTSSGTSYQIAGVIDELQLDNSADTSCPVVLKSGGLSTRKNVAPRPFLEWNVSLQDPAKSSHLYLSEVAIALGALELKIEEEFIDSVTTFKNALTARASSGQPDAQKDFLESKYFAKRIAEREPTNDSEAQVNEMNGLLWEKTKLDSTNNFVYIDNLILPTVRCLLSYYQDPSSTYSKDFTVVSLLAVAVGGFEHFPLDMKGYHSDCLYKPLDILLEEVVTHYKKRLLDGLLSILLSLNILGNPSQVVRQFSSGIDNLLDSHGDESLRVVAEGAGLVARNSLSGFFAVVSSSTGSLAGLASLGSVDRKFMHSRATLRKKGASNLLQGFEQGGTSLIKGTASGLWGVVAQPIKQFKEEPSAKGVVKGILKGLAGLVTKPLSGYLDAISKTAEGIQQTANEETSERLRIRPPRAFYLLDDSIKEYSYEDAVFYRGLANREDRLVVGFGGLAIGRSLVYLALTTAFVEALDEQSKRLLIPIQDVIATTLTDSQIRLLFKTSDGRKSITLKVIAGQESAKQMYEEFTLNLSVLQAKSK